MLKINKNIIIEDSDNTFENIGKWKYAGIVTGNNNFDLTTIAEKFETLLFVVTITSPDGYFVGGSIEVPKNVLIDDYVYFDTGSIVTTLRVGVNKTTCSINTATNNNQNVISSAFLRVYYK